MADQKLHYENMGGLLIRRDGFLHWRCPDCKAEVNPKMCCASARSASNQTRKTIMTNQQGAPEALRLAGAVDHWARGDYGLRGDEMRKAAAELRRLHYENERLAALVEAQQPATHVQDQAEIEHVAGCVSKNGDESNMTQQLSPSVAVALSDDLRDRLVAISEAIADQNDRAAQAMLREILKAPQPSPTPQADSQSVLDRDRIREIFMAHGFTVKEGQTDLKQYVYDAADALLRAARATADSVTAPTSWATWQDISTAPKDGTRFVAVGNNYGLYSEAQHTCIAQWFRGCWMEVSEWNEDSELKYLTHWMPLPPLPGSAARAPADSVREDAARYRWLRQHWFTMLSNYQRGITFKLGGPRWSDITEAELDAAIDAARKQGGA